MKITFLQQNIKNQDALQKGLLEAQNDLASINIVLGYSLRPTDRVFTTQPFTNSVMSGAEVVPEEILAEVDGSEDIAFLIFSNENMNPKPLNPICTYEKKVNAVPCQICEEWYNDYDAVFEEFVEHELCHAYSYKKGKIDITHLLTDGTLQSQNPVLYKYFSTQPTKNWYLYLLNGLINVPNEMNLPPDDPHFMFNRDTGALNTRYTGIQSPITNETPEVVSETIPQIITRVCLANGVEPSLGIAVAECEGGLANAHVTRINTDSHKSTDRGIFQYNSYWQSQITDARAFDPEQATQAFCDFVKAGKLVELWHLSQPCWSTKLSSDVKQKYGL